MQELPSLQGTEKQVTWANAIRNPAITDCEKEVQGFRDRKQPEDWVQEIDQAFFEIMSSPEKLQASWWIDHRVDRPQIVGQRKPVGGTWEMIVSDELKEKLQTRKMQREGRV